MTEITPGPWHIEDTNDAGDLYIAAADGHPIAIVRSGMFGETPTEANARLIAAAPDLLAAAEGFLVESERRWQFMVDRGDVKNEERSDFEAPDILAMKAAIAKATGVPA